MHYEIWAIDTANLIATPDTEAEALALVGELIDDGWDAKDLALGIGFGDGETPTSGLPPALLGEELAARARAASSEQESLSA